MKDTLNKNEYWFGFFTPIILAAAWTLYTGITYQPTAETYVKPKAAGRAIEKLVQYTEKHKVPIHEFKGPYFKESLGLDFPVYFVCYSHPQYYFCFDDWNNRVLARPLKPNEKITYK